MLTSFNREILRRESRNALARSLRLASIETAVGGHYRQLATPV